MSPDIVGANYPETPIYGKIITDNFSRVFGGFAPEQ
jgi:hypothetical protein